MLLDELESGKVFYFFSEISKIPHGSGNTEALARYCVNFADERGFKSYRDEYGNIMIFKDGTSGYKHSESVILQGWCARKVRAAIRIWSRKELTL